MGILDRILKALAPGKVSGGHSRRVKNYGCESMSGVGYARHGASVIESDLDTWETVEASPRDDCDKNLPTLRKRSRDLYMSSSFFGAILHAKRDGVIGRGLKLDAKIDAEELGLTDAGAVEYEHKIESAFRRFSRNVGVNGESLTEILQSAYFASILSGDCLVEVYVYPDSNTLRVRLIESDLLVTPPDQSFNPNIRMGIQFKDNGRPIAYWIASHFPNNSDGFQITYRRRAAFMAGYNTILGQWAAPQNGALFVHTPFERPGQTRGLPVASRVLYDMKQLDRYMKAELDASVAASKPALFRNHPAIDNEAEVDSFDSFGVPSGGCSASEGDPNAESVNEPPVNYGNGLMIDLYNGATMSAFNPLRPNQAYSNFVDHKFSEIAANLGMSAEVALKKWNASYSASRAALLDAQQGFEIERSRFINQLLRPLYNAWLDLNADKLGLFDYYTDPEKRSAWRCAEWVGEQLPNIDPTKEVDAAAKRVSLCVSTLAREAQIATGTDIFANIRQRGYEEQLLRKFGLVKDQNGVPIQDRESQEANYDNQQQQ